ncbi:MAG: serine/threonine-protein kinase PksC [Gemmatimonadetes bacterium]|nr:serine/threonine-protein kinase PksC [Gemmatimonadota bacterium]
MPEPGIVRARYQGLAAARRWAHEPARPRADFSLAVGDRVGELTVIGHLARGRATELYQVWSNKHWCALTGKLVAPDHLQNGVPQSFRKERQALAKLRHPNIVQLFGSGVADGRPYLLLEYLAGPSLFEVLEGLPKRRLHVPDAIRAVMGVGAAVHYLHRCGLLYRDLKPANIHLREGVPVLLDFDVVREIEPRRRPADRLGTAPYMAPEQVLREPLTPATDVYGLGALLYEMLTGRWPQETVEEAQDEEWEDEDWDDEPAASAAPVTAPGTGDPLRNLSPRELELRYPQLGQPATPPHLHNPQVTGELEQVVQRALSRDPCKRYQTISGMLAALSPLLKGRNRLWPENAPVERRADTETR